MATLGEGFVGIIPDRYQLEFPERQLTGEVSAAVEASLKGLSQEGCPGFGSCDGLARELGGISTLGSIMSPALSENCASCITVNAQNPRQGGNHAA